jgi:type I restriction enzyme M protein
MNHSAIANFFWGVADLIRDTFKRGKCRDIILAPTVLRLAPTVLRRLDSVFAATNEKALRALMTCNGKLDYLDSLERPASGFAFCNTSRYDSDTLAADAPRRVPNLRNHIAGFSPHIPEELGR